MKKCYDCQNIKTNSYSNLSSERETAKQLNIHPSLVLINSSSGWTEMENIFYCKACGSVFNLYVSFSTEEDDESEYGCFCLTDKNKKDSKLRYVGEYFLMLEKENEVKKLQNQEGDITVYLSGHVNLLDKLKNGEKVSVNDLRNEVFFSFSDMLGRYSQVRWFVNCRYYIKTNIPKKSLSSTTVATESNLGSGHGGFTISSEHLLSLEDVLVFDPEKSDFVPLSNWSVPPVYSQDAPEVDKLFDLYKPVVKKHSGIYKETIKREEKKEEMFVNNLYN